MAACHIEDVKICIVIDGHQEEAVPSVFFLNTFTKISFVPQEHFSLIIYLVKNLSPPPPFFKGE
jgi:hypothetical protein